MTRITRVLSSLVFASAVLLLGGCTAGAFDPKNAQEPADGLTLQENYQQVVEKVLPSVVEITTAEGLGSGIIYDDAGHVVTNAHVVGSATTFEVTPAVGGDTLEATLVASYPAEDIAVIQVRGDLPGSPATFADSTQLKVGQIVLAMGNPLGLTGSVSQGIVSAVGRTETERRTADSPGATLADMIQTTAAINPGNSGGALADLAGNVVGIPTLAATGAQDGAAAPGIGFAISASTATRIADQLIADGKVVDSDRAALGVTVRGVIDSQSRALGVGVVAVNAGGPAATAGIQPGDIITAIDGTPIPTVTELNVLLASKKPGDQVTVTITRADSNMDVPVTLGEL
ncbi:S1C family serine protease [Phytomonospora endophytica]|uniref:S1-C subfamily serine protease n=1 Tax=Phytomonospora endophytica TaxID=714109 RepID=A0A841FGL6_9ACTN|nr:trypsin-like peptidase domain-containing protein [Phytomonospora endophytica]MBB6032988.1 S1-C subfamily serine protease [Phytomonospora endophytica]GIG65214.1 protease [Phytomonospora endophytica]